SFLLTLIKRNELGRDSGRNALLLKKQQKQRSEAESQPARLARQEASAHGERQGTPSIRALASRHAFA
ncbi:hypothetical protein, partial [Luteimonas aquatica]|uniref:hypothetical protein n=1 Tax=Luteimonas aquatica TaxID=450364 RepID=UPI001F59EA5C